MLNMQRAFKFKIQHVITQEMIIIRVLRRWEDSPGAFQLGKEDEVTNKTEREHSVKQERTKRKEPSGCQIESMTQRRQRSALLNGADKYSKMSNKNCLKRNQFFTSKK